MAEDGWYWVICEDRGLEVAKLTRGYWCFTDPKQYIETELARLEVAKKIHEPENVYD